MIHPINLPEELLSPNPTRPSLIELRRKPKITYGPDGRKMRDGMPTTPKSPNTLWESVFIRGFIHRIAYDAKAEVEETSSVESLIDVIDFQPTSNADVIPSATDRPLINDDDHIIEPKFAFDSRTTDGPNDEEDEGQGVIVRRTSSKQFYKSSPSEIIDPTIINPILTPCCSCEL